MPTQEQAIGGRYQTAGVIGHGGMGIVYTAKDRLTGEMVALKKVLVSVHNLIFQSKGSVETDDVNLSLAQEFRVLSSLRHPHIVSVYDYGFTAEKTPYFTMELLDNSVTLTKASANFKRTKKIELIIQLLQAIGYLHRRGILHQDLKPSNIMVVNGQVKVLDFGLAQEHIDETTDQTDKLVGTLPYLAPELFESISNSRVSDLWAVGIMLYEIFAGEHPFKAKTVMQLIANIGNDTPDYAKLADTPELIPVIEKLLAKDRADRFQQAYEVIEAICEALSIPLPPETALIRESFLQAARFIGRETERQQIMADLPVNTQSQSSVWLLGGESGVGKSRLAEEIRSRTLIQGIPVLRGQAVVGGGMLFQVWREPIRHLLLLQDVNDLQAGVLKEIVPDIEHLLDRAIPAVPKLEGRRHQDRLSLTIIDLLRDLPHPVLLLLEDLQWIDHSLDVLQRILQVLDQLPGIMILGTYRDDEWPNLPQELPSSNGLVLSRLDANEIGKLSEAILGDVGRDSAIIDLLITETEGNTFFVVEIMRALAEEAGVLSQIGTQTLRQNILTGGIQQLMRRRLHKVAKRHHELQTLAALIGREIDTRLLDHLYGKSTVEAWLGNASEAAVLTVQNNVWRFAHDKLRETILSDMPSDAKPRLHRMAAEMLEAVYPENDAYYEALLGHWKNAQNLLKEIYYTDAVTSQMIKYQGDYSQANTLLLDVLDRLPANHLLGPSLYNRLATTYQKRGQQEEATRYAQKAQALAQNFNDDVELAGSLRILGVIATEQGNYDEAMQVFQRGLSIFEKLNNDVGIALCLNNLANIHRSKGEYDEAIELYQRGLRMSRQLNDLYMTSIYLNNLGVGYEALGNYTEATKLYEQNLAIAQEAGIRDSVGLAYVNLGNIAYHRADYEVAEQRYRQSLEIFAQIGNKYVVAVLYSNLGEVARINGDYKRTREFIQQSLDIRHRIKDKFGIANSLKILGIIALEQKNYLEAKKQFEQGLAIYQEIGARPDESHTLAYLGWILIKQNHVDEKLFAKSLQIAQETGVALHQLFNVIGIAAMLYQKNMFEKSAEYLGLVQHHPKNDSNVMLLVNDLRTSLEAQMSANELDTAIQRGGQLELETVVTSWLTNVGA